MTEKDGIFAPKILDKIFVYAIFISDRNEELNRGSKGG